MILIKNGSMWAIKIQNRYNNYLGTGETFYVITRWMLDETIDERLKTFQQWTEAFEKDYLPSEPWIGDV